MIETSVFHRNCSIRHIKTIHGCVHVASYLNSTATAPRPAYPATCRGLEGHSSGCYIFPTSDTRPAFFREASRRPAIIVKPPCLLSSLLEEM